MVVDLRTLLLFGVVLTGGWLQDAQSGHAGAATASPPMGSRVIGKRDRMIAGGRKICAIDFVYAGRAPEDVFWQEPCADVTAIMIDRAELERLDRWSRLDAAQQRFVERMPGGRVLYVGGTFSASVYPVDDTGSSIEVEVAD